MSKARSKKKQRRQKLAVKRLEQRSAVRVAGNTNLAPQTATEALSVENRPTPERRRHGIWADPQGAGKSMLPVVDLASDMIGELYEARKITSGQEQAARTFQEVRADFVAELGVSSYGSCLDASQKGYDGSDGNPEAISRYRALENRIGRIKTALLRHETDKPAGAKPNDLDALRNALDCVGA